MRPSSPNGYGARTWPSISRACRIARKGVEDKARLGRHRWVVERTLARLNHFRRLAIRYERREDVHQALLDLGCALICLRRLQEAVQ